MRNIFIIATLLISFCGNAQKNQTTYIITYQMANSKRQINISYQDQMVYLSKPVDKIQNYIDLKNERNISSINHQDTTYQLLTPFNELPQPVLKEETENILGYNCKKATYTYFSNRIDVWYTEKTKAKGSPYQRYLPNKNALVLKVMINGGREITATDVSENENQLSAFSISPSAKTVSQAEFEEIKINSRYDRIQIFKEEQVNFNPELVVAKGDQLKNDVTYRFSKGSVIMKKIKLTDRLKNSAYVFAKLHCKSNGDAYDRTGSVFIIPGKNEGLVTLLDAYQKGIEVLPVYQDNSGQQYQGISRTDQYMPPIEIMRFFTSFGADHFNEKREINNYDWATNVEYKQEVTALIPNDQDEIWVGVFVGNYDSGGHIVNLELDFYPDFGEDKDGKIKYIQPLFSTLNTLEMSGQNYGRLFDNDTLEVNFEINQQIENLTLLYTSTGHGGWGGGDEFNPKVNQIFIDGEKSI